MLKLLLVWSSSYNCDLTYYEEDIVGNVEHVNALLIRLEITSSEANASKRGSLADVIYYDAFEKMGYIKMDLKRKNTTLTV